jgi:hypothetical protein
MEHRNVVEGVWGAVAASTFACLAAPGSGPRAPGYDPIPTRMEPRPAFDAWTVLVERLAGGASAAQAMAALEAELGYGEPTEADRAGIAAFWGLACFGRPSEAAAAAADGRLVAAMVAAPAGGLPAAIEAAGAGEAALAAKVALSLREPDLGLGCMREAATLLAAADGLGFEPAVEFAFSRGARAPEAFAALGARAGALHGVPAAWREPLGAAFVAGWGLRSLSVPESIADLATDVARAASVPAPVP